MRLNPFSSRTRPIVTGRLGAADAAHPLAVAAGQRLLAEDGNAVDALIAAQAVLAVVCPDAWGLDGDGLVLLRRPGMPIVAFKGAAPPVRSVTHATTTEGAAVTVRRLLDFRDCLSAEGGD